MPCMHGSGFIVAKSSLLRPVTSTQETWEVEHPGRVPDYGVKFNPNGSFSRLVI